MISDKLNFNLKQTNENKVHIRKNNNNIFNSVRDIIEIYNRKDISEEFAYFLGNLQNLSFAEVNDYFKQLIQRKTENKALIPFDAFTDSSKRIKTPQAPYIKTKSRKQYTLVLDLDETLIHLKLNNDNLKGVVTFRPGLFDFLDEVMKIYELVIFTCGTVQYAEPIIDSIESKKNYFDFRLYRDHTTFVNGEYVKDLSLVGRDLDKTIIVDNIPANFRLQKDNGIFIKSFYSHENNNDTSLYELIPVLKKIVENSPQDIRKELAKYKTEIVKKISTNLNTNNKVGRITSLVNNIAGIHS